MILYVLRHGIAEEVSASGDDASRRLTAQGRSRMQQAVAGLRRLGVAPGVVLTSPLPRAAETAAIVVAGLPDAPVSRELPALAPGVPPEETVRAMRPFARQRELMVIGHQPNLGHLAALLLTGSTEGVTVDLKKGGCAALELSGLVTRGRATLRWLLPPRVLRRLG